MDAAVCSTLAAVRRSFIFHTSRLVRSAWSADELHLVMIAFAENLSYSKLPAYVAIESLQKKYPMLRQRSREQIKACVWHEIKKRRTI